MSGYTPQRLRRPDLSFLDGSDLSPSKPKGINIDMPADVPPVHRTVLPFGKYKGRTFDSVAATQEGLRYLDWLRGQAYVMAPLKKALDSYLGQDEVARDLEAALLDD